MHACCVPDCKDRVSPRHCFPLYHEQIFNIWLERIGNVKLQAMNHEKIYKSYRVCSRHFSSFCKVPGTKKLKFGSLPTLFLPNFHEEPSEQNSVFRYPTKSQNTSISTEENSETSPAHKKRKSNQQSEEINIACTSHIKLMKIENDSSVNIIYQKPHYGQDIHTQRLSTPKDIIAKKAQKLNSLINATRIVQKNKSDAKGERLKHADNLETVSQNDADTADNTETLRKSILLEAYKLENNLRDVRDPVVLKHVAETLKSENKLLTINRNSMTSTSKIKIAEPPNECQKQIGFNSAKKRCLVGKLMFEPGTKEISNTKNISFSQREFISNSLRNDHNYIM